VNSDCRRCCDPPIGVIPNAALAPILMRFSNLRASATNDIRFAFTVTHVAYSAGGLGMNPLNRILPFLRPIEDLLLDRTVTEVMVNSGGRYVFVEREGTLEFVPGRSLEPPSLTAAIKNIARTCGDDVSDVTCPSSLAQ
jgi:hypothetical protein